MRAKKSQLRVLKLRSGEEIIGIVSAKPRGKITMSRPMKINASIITDPFTGLKKTVVFFSDWLDGATELEVDIPTDFILMDLTPDPDMEKLYSTQSEGSDTPTATDSKTAFADMKPPTAEELKKLDMLMQSLGFPGDDPFSGKGVSSTPPPPSSLFPPKSKGIIFSISVPQDIMNQWMEDGVLEYLKECVEDFMDPEMFGTTKPKKKTPTTPKREKTSKTNWKPPTPDQTKTPNHGNKYTDWSPFLSDYVDGKTGDNQNTEDCA